MGREYVVVWAGRHERAAWDDICARYRKRIARVRPVRELAVKVRGKGHGGDRLKAEGEALLAAVPEPVWRIALDPGGRTMSSEAFAAELTRLERDWPHPVAFLVGSDLGLAPEVLAAARSVLSLGPMILSHELARVVLHEQLYRAVSIAAGTGYHRSDRDRE